MKFVDINLTEDPVDIKEFKYIPNSEYPKIIIGTPIHHKYDQERIVSPKGSQNIFHIQSKPSIKMNFFKGIEITISKKYSELLEDISYMSSIEPPLIDSYKNILKKYNLTCNDCSLYYSPGIYPIDGCHLNILTNNRLKIKNVYTNFFKKQKENCFQCYSSLNVFILTSNYQSDEIYENLFHSEETLLEA